MPKLPKIDFFGKEAEFHHAGFAVPSIQKAYRGLSQAVDRRQKVKVAFFKMHGVKVELVEPLGKSSPVSRMLKKGQSLYHLCFAVKDLDSAVRRARKRGFHCITRPVPAGAFGRRKITWLFSKTYGLMELLER